MTFYFAWAGPGETFGPGHEVEDEQVAAVEIRHAEGDFATLTIAIRNPQAGFLAPGADQWAFLAYEGDDTDGAVPLFYGRIIGVPQDMQGNVVQLVFRAKPVGFTDAKAALAATLKVAPWWDPVWVLGDRRDDPDAVLEARTQLWHIDRVDHAVTVSDIIAGEDGTVTFATFDHDSVRTSFGATPLTSVSVEAEGHWEQAGTGRVDVTDKIIAAFATAGTTRANAITSFTGGGLMEDWPTEGARIGGGWTFGASSVTRTDGYFWPQQYQQSVFGGLPLSGGFYLGNVFVNAVPRANFPLWTMAPLVTVDYEASRPRAERIRFTLTADVQALVADPGDDEHEAITLSSRDIDQPIDAGGLRPIRDARRKAYFPTDRGLESVEYLITLARSRLLASARCVFVTFTVPFADAVHLSCRMNGVIEDPRLPGGQAAGKIVAYGLSVADGRLTGSVTLGCTIGKGGTVTAVAGDPDYVEEGYVATGYQTYTGRTVMPVAGEVAYEDFSGVAPTDDGLDLQNMSADHVVEQVTVTGGETVQRAVLEAARDDLNEAVEALNAVHTEVYMKLRRLTIDGDVYGRRFETAYDLTVTDLAVPKTIDLEEGATA